MPLPWLEQAGVFPQRHLCSMASAPLLPSWLPMAAAGTTPFSPSLLPCYLHSSMAMAPPALPCPQPGNAQDQHPPLPNAPISPCSLFDAGALLFPHGAPFQPQRRSTSLLSWAPASGATALVVPLLFPWIAAARLLPSHGTPDVFPPTCSTHFHACVLLRSAVGAC
jgi:hypothetical protein